MPRARITTLPTTPPPIRPALYLRVSTEEQAQSGYGLDVQRARCHAAAVAKGWPTPVEYADEGISGTKGPSDRPQLARLLQDAEAKQINTVIVLALDRLGRRTRLILELVDTLATAGAALVSCKESLDTTTPQGQFVLTLFAGLAQLERDTIVERTTAGRNERGKKDGEMGGRVPYGYTRHADGVTINQEQAEIVRAIFALRHAGLSLRAISQRFAAVPGPRGGSWPASSIKALLDNAAAYQGGKRGASKARWPKIVEI